MQRRARRGGRLRQDRLTWGLALWSSVLLPRHRCGVAVVDSSFLNPCAAGQKTCSQSQVLPSGNIEIGEGLPPYSSAACYGALDRQSWRVSHPAVLTRGEGGGKERVHDDEKDAQ